MASPVDLSVFWDENYMISAIPASMLYTLIVHWDPPWYLLWIAKPTTFYHGGFYFSTLSNATAYSILPISDGGLKDFLIQLGIDLKTSIFWYENGHFKQSCRIIWWNIFPCIFSFLRWWAEHAHSPDMRHSSEYFGLRNQTNLKSHANGVVSDNRVHGIPQIRFYDSVHIPWSSSCLRCYWILKLLKKDHMR